MRRVAFFVALGPFLAWLTFWLLQLPEVVTKPLPDNFGFVFAFLLAAYIGGFVPLLAAAGVDEVLARNNVQRLVRAVACGAVGYAGAVAAFYFAAQGAPSEFAKYWFTLGLMGAVSASVCSWLSGKINGAG